MATYKEVKGVTIQTLSEDPVVNAGSWSSGGNMNTARELFASAGTVHTAALASAGYNGSTHVNNVEQYDGTSWTELNDLSSGRSSVRSAGSSSNCIANGGYISAYSNLTEEWTSSLGNKTITAS